MPTKHETPLALALVCLLLSGAAVLAAGIGEAFDPEPPGMYWVDLEAEPGPGLSARPTWPSASHPAPGLAALPLPPHLSDGGEFGFLAPAPPDGAPPWPEAAGDGPLLDGAYHSLADAPPSAPPLGV
jgi:hypothetical protein